MEEVKKLFIIFTNIVDTNTLNEKQLMAFNKLVTFWNNYKEYNTEYLWDIKSYHSVLAGKYYKQDEFNNYISAISRLRVQLMSSYL